LRTNAPTAFGDSAPAPFSASAPVPYTSGPVPFTSAPMPFSATTGAMPLEARSVEPKVALEPARTADSVFMEDLEGLDLSLDADVSEPAPPRRRPPPRPSVEAAPPRPRAPAARNVHPKVIPAKRSREEEEQAADEDARAGPPTLASMLPESGEWPPRRKTKERNKDKPAPTPEDAVVEIDEEAPAPVADEKDPRFLREARRDERWSRPWVRTSLSGALVVLVLGAAAQVAYPMRDTIASRWPSTMPLWTTICEQLDCTIEAPRSLASLALDGSSLTRTDTEHVLLFSADLHNRSDQAVRMPSFDLTFMDLNGQIVARKVLDPAQIGINQTSIGPQAELHVHARLQVDGLDASGFQADMFYP
jgi:hypothetical protein